MRKDTKNAILEYKKQQFTGVWYNITGRGTHGHVELKRCENNKGGAHTPQITVKKEYIFGSIRLQVKPMGKV